MIIIVHAENNEDTIDQHLGTDAYSYYFVLKEFRPVLEELGIVVTVDNPLSEVDPIFTICQHLGEVCIFLSFTPPHHTPVDLECPTIPVFAWEFYDIPCETWDDDPQNDWRFVLDRLGCAITHSRFAVQTVRKAMGSDFPIVSIPAPVWDRFATPGKKPADPLDSSGFELTVKGRIRDSRVIAPYDSGAKPEPLNSTVSIELNLEDLSAFSPDTTSKPGTTVITPKANGPASVKIDGIVYATIFNPEDGRKNWLEILKTFCWTFRDAEDATLVLKFVHHNYPQGEHNFLTHIYKLAPFKCRVVMINGFLSDEDYTRLANGSTYAVNASLGEGQCLPLMEYMSCGKPAIAPRHTGMEDYIDDKNAFLVHSSLELAEWPHDPRKKYRTLRHRIDAGSLQAALQESYRVAKEDPARYRAMSQNAVQRLREHCSRQVVKEKLGSFLAQQGKRRQSVSREESL